MMGNTPPKRSRLIVGNDCLMHDTEINFSCRAAPTKYSRCNADVCAMKPHKRRPFRRVLLPLSVVVFCLLTDLPSISEMAYPCTYQIVYLVTTWQYHRSKELVRAIVCHARVRNIHLRNVPEHIPSGSSVPFKSITTVPATIKKCPFEIHLEQPVIKVFGSNRTCFALLVLSSLNIHSKCFPVDSIVKIRKYLNVQ